MGNITWWEAIDSFFVTFNFITFNFKWPCILQLSPAHEQPLFWTDLFMFNCHSNFLFLILTRKQSNISLYLTLPHFTYFFGTDSRLLGHSQQQQTKNDYLQKTDTYWPITRPVFVQPDLSQGHYYPDSDETSATSLWLTWQPTRWDWLS